MEPSIQFARVASRLLPPHPNANSSSSLSSNASICARNLPLGQASISEDETTEKLRYSQPHKGHYGNVTNPVLQDPARIELVPSDRYETPALEVVLSLARQEVLLAPNGSGRTRALRHEAELLLGLLTAFAGHP
jgi:hypothetical protein